jgi:hypothetical protein
MSTLQPLQVSSEKPSLWPAHGRQLRRKRSPEFGRRSDTTTWSLAHEVFHLPEHLLDKSTRVLMEPRFGQDFSHVRVHTGPPAVQLGTHVHPLADIVGRDLVFGAAEYTPRTHAEQDVMAPELAHTIKQGAPGMRATARLPVAEAGSELQLLRDFFADSTIQIVPGAERGQIFRVYRNSRGDCIRTRARSSRGAEAGLDAISIQVITRDGKTHTAEEYRRILEEEWWKNKLSGNGSAESPSSTTVGAAFPHSA